MPSSALLMSLFLVAACWLDLRQRKLPNSLTVACLISGLLLQVFAPTGQGLLHPTASGSEGLTQAALAVLLMLCISLPLWRLKLFGAGDAKLLTALAAFVGLKGVLPLLLLSLSVGAVLAIWGMLLRRRRVHHSPEMIESAAPAKVVSLPYSLAIAGGAWLWIILQKMGLLNI